MAGEAVPVLVGCTASGKSMAAMDFALRHPGVEIVSGDSRQLYRGMDIGTAKPGARDRALVPHHLLDVADPDTILSAGWFAETACRTVSSIIERGGRPLVVGGSALYLMAMAGMTDSLPGRNDGLRSALEMLEQSVPGSLHRILSTLDPESRVAPSDRVRLLRALEICLESGERASDLRRGGSFSGSFRFVMLDAGSGALRPRIDRRVDEMVQQGLVDEVRGLLARGFGREPVLGNTIGYREILDHLEGRLPLEEAVRAVKVNTWRYARRQRNMFKRLPGLLRADSPEALERFLEAGGENGKGY